jgi:glycosyltransferase involved in cell wall biosynthesis
MLVIDSIIFSIQKVGGISVYFSEVLKRLPKSELLYSLLIYKNKSKILEEYNQENIVPIKSSILPLAIVRYIDVYLPSKCTLFHSSYYRLPVFCQRKKVKIITTVHDFTYERYIGGSSARIHHWQKKRAILASDVVICISENTKKDLLHYIPKAHTFDIRVIYNGVSDDFYSTDKPKWQLSEQRYVVFIGARGGYKNFNSLVEALKLLPNVHLKIVGGGELNDIEVDILSENIRDRYSHSKFATNDELNVIYNHAFCLVYPSLYEGFGIPAIEAMKAGCPVIAANSSSLPEVCGKAAILLDTITPETISEAVISLDDYALRCSLINDGYENAKRFSWDKTYRELEKIYLG